MYVVALMVSVACGAPGESGPSLGVRIAEGADGVFVTMVVADSRAKAATRGVSAGEATDMLHLALMTPRTGNALFSRPIVRWSRSFRRSTLTIVHGWRSHRSATTA